MEIDCPYKKCGCPKKVLHNKTDIIGATVEADFPKHKREPVNQ